MNKYHLDVRLTDRQHRILKQKAIAEGKSITDYVKDTLQLNSHSSTNSIYIPSIKHNHLHRTKCIKAYFTEAEYYYIKSNAGNESLSSYVSRCAIQGQNVLQISVDDEYYRHLSNIVEPLFYSLYQSYFAFTSSDEDTMKLLEELIPKIDEANNRFVELLIKFKKLREGIRQTELRTLTKKCNYVLQNYDYIVAEAEE